VGAFGREVRFGFFPPECPHRTVYPFGIKLPQGDKHETNREKNTKI